MNADASELQNQPVFHFVTFARGVTQRGLSVGFPPGALEALPLRHDFHELQAYQRATYAQTSQTDPDPDIASEREDASAADDAHDPRGGPVGDPDYGGSDRGSDATGRGKPGDEDGYEW